MKTSQQKIVNDWASSLTMDDLLLIHNALNEIINGPSAIAPWEFQTRVGVELLEAENLLHKIGLALNESSKESQ